MSDVVHLDDHQKELFNIGMWAHSEGQKLGANVERKRIIKLLDTNAFYAILDDYLEDESMSRDHAVEAIIALIKETSK